MQTAHVLYELVLSWKVHSNILNRYLSNIWHNPWFVLVSKLICCLVNAYDTHSISSSQRQDLENYEASRDDQHMAACLILKLCNQVA